jgi:hypothetical protein
MQNGHPPRYSSQSCVVLFNLVLKFYDVARDRLDTMLASMTEVAVRTANGLHSRHHVLGPPDQAGTVRIIIDAGLPSRTLGVRGIIFIHKLRLESARAAYLALRSVHNLPEPGPGAHHTQPFRVVSQSIHAAQALSANITGATLLATSVSLSYSLANFPFDYTAFVGSDPKLGI